MRILILTNPEHHKFVYETKEHHVLSGSSIYMYDEKFNFDLGFSYDIGISFMYQHKVPAKEVNTHPWFNFHPAPLPEYKGRDLCYHAIMNGEKEFGASLHYMDENFDTGDIIYVHKFPILPHYTAEDVSTAAMGLAETMFSLYLPDILENTVFPRIPNIGGTYYKKGGIEDEIPLHDIPLSRWIRAVTYKNFYPKIDIGGVKYKIVREE